MMFLVMGLASLVAIFFLLIPAARRLPTLRDKYLVSVTTIVFIVFALAAIWEGADRLGWWR